MQSVRSLFGRLLSADFGNISFYRRKKFGGNSFIGGEGSIVAAAVGALIIVFIRNGMNILGVDTTWQQAVIGFVILASIGLEALTRGLTKKKD